MTAVHIWTHIAGHHPWLGEVWPGRRIYAPDDLTEAQAALLKEQGHLRVESIHDLERLED